VTAGGIGFVGATSFDKQLRRSIRETGKLLWETTLRLPGKRDAGDLRVGRAAVVVIEGAAENRARLRAA